MKGCETMGRPKGGTNRFWSQEEKLRIVNRYLDEGISSVKLAKEEHISDGMLRQWIRSYLNEGPDSLVNKRKTGNPFAALHTSKVLSEEERLRLIIAKQEIEIERLKKEYFVKGDGAQKVFVITKNVSLK